MRLDVPIVFLAGGAGTRLRSLSPNIPKPLMPVAGLPILNHQINELRKHGFYRFFFLLHHQSQLIKDHILSHKVSSETCDFICEQKPRGTGGAVMDALHDLPDEFILTFADMAFSLQNFATQFPQASNRCFMSLPQ